MDVVVTGVEGWELALSLLAPLYPPECLLALVADMQEHRDELVRIQADVQLGEAELSDLVVYLLDLLTYVS